MFIDRADILVRSGKGGDGRCSFRREKFVPKGGPDGGDGGRGGDVILRADPHLDTLLPFAHRRRFVAGDGEAGGASNRQGADGESTVVAVPVGCLIHEAESDRLIADLCRPGQELVVARGGAGGLGNDRFKTSVQQAPTRTTPGEAAQELRLRLELKLLADVGLVGLPNAGKSTMLRAVSRATPKVADYPFTTLSPQLGIAELPGERRLVVADIPGLIEGAAEGAGLGHDFLRHLERTSVLIHLVDAGSVEGQGPIEAYRTIRRELEAFAPTLASKPEIVALNKFDLLDDAERDAQVSAFAAAIGTSPDRIRCVSGATGFGTRELLESAWSAVAENREAAVIDDQGD